MMDMVWLLLGVIGVTIGAAALWRCRMLAKELQQLKRAQYYSESRMKRVPEEIRDAVQPLRWQLANLTAGKPVLQELIVSGRVYADITAEDAQRLIEDNGGYQSEHLLVVDVRTPKEFAAKHVPNATLVPFEELDTRYRADIPDTREKILVYCSSGERSRLACDVLGRAGYTNLYNVQDGLQAWRGPTEGEGGIAFIKLERRR
jgi:rhodanese-related sulfurtransferase